jgi:hypothetical protein
MVAPALLLGQRLLEQVEVVVVQPVLALLQLQQLHHLIQQ